MWGMVAVKRGGKAGDFRFWIVLSGNLCAPSGELGEREEARGEAGEDEVSVVWSGERGRRYERRGLRGMFG